MLITDTLSPQAFEEALRAKGAFYHIHHPYHIAMHNGDATREQIQGWVANRFYYQTTIPLKDAAIMVTARMRRPGANGCSGSSTTTAATARTAGLKPGCGWGKRSV